MLRFLWKCVLEVLPPTCATVVAGILLSAYHDHILALQDVIDPRASVEQVTAPATAGDKQPQAVIAPEVRSERPTEPAQIADKSPAPAAHVNSPTPAPEGDRADGAASETKTPEGSDTKTAQGATTDSRAAQLNAVLMASSPMSQPPAEIKAAQPLETKASEGPATASEGAAAAGLSVMAPPEPAAAVPATDVSSPAAKPAATKSPDSPTVAPITRPRLSQHLAKPARKATVVKMESERLPPPVVAMVPLPPPAAPPVVAMESQVSPSRSVLPSHALPPPAPGAPQAIGPTPPMGSNPVVAGATGPAPSLPGAPEGGANASQEGVAKTPEPTRVFGVPIPPSIAAVGGALDPRPVFSAGQKAFEKIVMTAKSVVPDFGHEQ
jgi:hypothetical protein